MGRQEESAKRTVDKSRGADHRSPPVRRASGRKSALLSRPGPRLAPYAGTLLVLAVAGLVISMPFVYRLADDGSAAGAGDDKLRTSAFVDQEGKARNTAEFAGSVVVMMFFYPVHDLATPPTSSSPVYFTEGAKSEFDAFAALQAQYASAAAGTTAAPEGEKPDVTLLTVIVPRVCCTRRMLPTYFSGPGFYNYDLARVTWNLTNDGDYSMLKTYGTYIKKDSFDMSSAGAVFDSPLASDPMTIIADREFRPRFVMPGGVDAVQLGARIDLLLSDDPAAAPPPVVVRPVDMLALVSLLAIFGLLSMISPCCVGMAVGSVSSVLSIHREARRRLARAEALLIGLAFSLGMGLVFFALGTVVSTAGFVLPTGALLGVTAAMLFVMGAAAFGAHRRLASALHAWRRRTTEKMSRSGHEHRSRDAGDGSCPHCAGSPGSKRGAAPATPGKKTVDGAGARRSSPLGVASFGSGALFGVVGIPCAAIFVVPALVLVASRELPLLVGGALMFVFGFARGLPMVPISLGAGRLSSGRGRLGAFVARRRRALTMVHAGVLVGLGAYTAYFAWLYYA